METLRIDGYIGKDDGMSVLFGGSPNFSLKSLNEFLDNLPAGVTEIKIEINSGGGSVTEGFAIHDRLVASGLKIHTEVLGLCGSIATIIALAATKENRSMHENSEYFIHNPFWQPMSPEAMEADDLQQLADDLRNSEEKILDFYASKTGQKRSQLKTFMDDSKGFSAKEAKQLGFVSKIIGEAVATQKYQLVAFIDPHKKTKPTDMEFTPAQKSWIEQKFNAFGEKLNKIFTPVPLKAMTVDLENGSKIFIDSETEDIVGKSVFLTDDTGAKTEPAPDGEYVTKDGRTIKVAGGKCTEVMMPQNEVAALKKQVADLTTQLEAANGKAQSAETAKAEQEQKVEAMKQEITDFKNMVLTKGIPPADQAFKGSEPVEKKSMNEQLIELRKKRAEQNKK